MLEEDNFDVIIYVNIWRSILISSLNNFNNIILFLNVSLGFYIIICFVFEFILVVDNIIYFVFGIIMVFDIIIYSMRFIFKMMSYILIIMFYFEVLMGVFLFLVVLL